MPRRPGSACLLVKGGYTFAQVQVPARAGDPFYELAFRLAGSKLQDQIWRQTNLFFGGHARSIPSDVWR